MIIYPAIDLRGGKVVRLREGNPDHETIFSEDPVATAQGWMREGAEWIHVVNLDGAFAESNNNGAILEAIAGLGAKVQFGGGLRQMDDISRAVEQGASRVVLGTAIVQQPEMMTQALERFGPEAVCVALDARDGKIATHGWQQASDWTPLDFGREMAKRGVIHALYTDVSRDGRLGGVNVHETIALARDTGLKVIASGGVSSTTELDQLARSNVVAGAVIGMALYEGRMTLGEALIAAARKQ
jgi:phosphoribosylformimino-5-aminoimidazole carboxamide ribotide isomerase